MNCRRRCYINRHLTSNLLPHYPAKFELTQSLLFLCQYRRSLPDRASSMRPRMQRLENDGALHFNIGYFCGRPVWHYPTRDLPRMCLFWVNFFRRRTVFQLLIPEVERRCRNRVPKNLLCGKWPLNWKITRKCLPHVLQYCLKACGRSCYGERPLASRQ